MAAVFGGVLLCSFGIQKALSPAGNAMIRTLDRHEVVVTGLIHSGTVVADSRLTYRLANPGVARPYAGQRVNIRGTFHEATGLLEVREIQLAPAQHLAASGLDRAANPQ